MAVLKLIKDKFWGRKEEREKCLDVAYELHNKKIIDTKTFDVFMKK